MTTYLSKNDEVKQYFSEIKPLKKNKKNRIYKNFTLKYIQENEFYSFALFRKLK
jgi:hypothetical protein